MAKVTTRISVKGTDLKEMMARAVEQLTDLSDATWTITEINLWGMDDAATKEGMVRMWNAEMSLEANIT